LKNFILPNKPIVPNFQRKQGDKVIWMREEKGKRGEKGT
jgi:hypothetical protein